MERKSDVLISLRVHDGEASCEYDSPDVNHQLTIERDEHGEIWYTHTDGLTGTKCSYSSPKLHTSPWVCSRFTNMGRWYNDQQVLAIEPPFEREPSYYQMIPRFWHPTNKREHVTKMEVVS